MDIDTANEPNAPVANSAAQKAYPISERTLAQIENAFTYHTPKEDQPYRYNLIRNNARYLAEEIARSTPPSREQALALTHLEDAVMWANAAIARHE